MHRYAEPKHFLERVVFRAPPAGTGSITFRALLKQGDTNQGAFYWPSVPSSGLSATLDPSPGRSGGDLVLDELVPAPSAARTWSFRGAPGEPCTAVCATQGLACDAEQLLAATSAEALLARVESLEPLIKALSSCGHDLDTVLNYGTLTGATTLGIFPEPLNVANASTFFNGPPRPIADPEAATQLLLRDVKAGLRDASVAGDL